MNNCLLFIIHSHYTTITSVLMSLSGFNHGVQYLLLIKFMFNWKYINMKYYYRIRPLKLKPKSNIAANRLQFQFNWFKSTIQISAAIIFREQLWFITFIYIFPLIEIIFPIFLKSWLKKNLTKTKKRSFYTYQISSSTRISFVYRISSTHPIHFRLANRGCQRKEEIVSRTL